MNRKMLFWFDLNIVVKKRSDNYKNHQEWALNEYEYLHYNLADLYQMMDDITLQSSQKSLELLFINI